MNRNFLSTLLLFGMVLSAGTFSFFEPADGFSGIQATGGTITTAGNYTIHTFTSSGNFTVTSGSGNVEVLIVAGGGGGGGTFTQSYKGGGGAGGLIQRNTYAVTVGSYMAQVGAGGGNNAGGGYSQFGTLAATGGGPGGDCTVAGTTPPNLAGRPGGSGGGGGHDQTGGGLCYPGGSGVPGQGFGGGRGWSGTQATGGAGGGAGAAGADSVGTVAMPGGIGKSFATSGANVTYAGGGGGGGQNNNGGGAGGAGGGGNGAKFSGASAPVSGTANTGGGAGGGSNTATGGSGVIIIRYPTFPHSVTDLVAVDNDYQSVDLDWSTPDTGSYQLRGYMINYTTPYGPPLSILVSNTSSSDTAYSVTGLTESTPYSFRVFPLVNASQVVPGGNIANVTTPARFIPANYTIGNINIDSVNPVTTPIKFQRIDLDPTTTLVNVTYSNAVDLSCDVSYLFTQTSQTYSNLTGIPISTTEQSASFQFTNATNDQITFYCYDTADNSARYVLTQDSFPMLDLIQGFRDGTFGTHGVFGALDFITLVVLIIAMLGFNRTNESVGAIMCLVAIFFIAYFGIINIGTAITGAAIIMIMLIFSTTRKD